MCNFLHSIGFLYKNKIMKTIRALCMILIISISACKKTDDSIESFIVSKGISQWDEINSWLEINYQGNCIVEDFKISIFNQAGALVFDSSHINIVWDGTINSKYTPGTYIWKITYKTSCTHYKEQYGLVQVF